MIRICSKLRYWLTLLQKHTRGFHTKLWCFYGVEVQTGKLKNNRKRSQEHKSYQTLCQQIIIFNMYMIHCFLMKEVTGTFSYICRMEKTFPNISRILKVFYDTFTLTNYQCMHSRTVVRILRLDLSWKGILTWQF